MLFQIDLTGIEPLDVFRQFWEDSDGAADSRAFAERLVLGVMRTRQYLDDVIAGSTENWRIERMAVVDRNVLRMAVYEMLFDHETPHAAIIDEGIEVARKFGSDASASFINGILDSVHRRMDRGEIAATAEGSQTAVP